jgi:hypothetical protein
MDHIGNYFSKVTQKLFQKINEKENFINIVKKQTGIDLKSNDFVIKENVIRLKIFGPKRKKILSTSDSILKDLNNIIRLE